MRGASGDVKGALKSFQAADTIMRVPTTGFELAKTQAAGLLVEARDTALRVTRMPVQPGEAAPFAEARSNSQQLSDELAERIPTLKIKVTGAADGEDPLVSVDWRKKAESLSVLPNLDTGYYHDGERRRRAEIGVQRTGKIEERDMALVTIDEHRRDTTPDADACRPKPILRVIAIGVYLEESAANNRSLPAKSTWNRLIVRDGIRRRRNPAPRRRRVGARGYLRRRT